MTTDTQQRISWQARQSAARLRNPTLTSLRPPEWMDSAHCASTSIPDAWFSAEEQEKDYAVAVCNGCPAKTACLIWALDRPYDSDYGVWGGLTRNQRRQLRRKAA